MHMGILYLALAGAAAGIVNGLFGAGGGMILVPMLSKSSQLTQEEIFPSSICIILPLCILSLLIQAMDSFPWTEAIPYLIGSGFGGIAAGIFGGKIPVKWLHKVLGILILWGGFRYLWN